VLKDAWEIARDAWRLFSGRGARFLGAAVAFFALLSAAPMTVLLLRAIGGIFGRDRAERALFEGLGTWLAPEGLTALRDLAERVDRSDSSSGWGVLLLVYASTRLFRAMHRAVNELRGVDLERIELERSRTVRYGLRYGRALLLVTFLGVVVSALVVEKAVVAFLSRWGAGQGPLVALDLAVSAVLAFVLFLVFFRVLPEDDISWREAATSAVASTILFALGSSLVTYYLRHKQLDDVYAGAGALVVAVLWVYYSAQVFFFGGCIGAALAAKRAGPTS
jgi:membrane protein